MSKRKRASDRAGRPAMRSPGRPPVGRLEHRQRFWAAIARGLSSEDAAAEAGVSAAVGVRWFRDGGGMPSRRARDPAWAHTHLLGSHASPWFAWFQLDTWEPFPAGRLERAHYWPSR